MRNEDSLRSLRTLKSEERPGGGLGYKRTCGVFISSQVGVWSVGVVDCSEVASRPAPLFGFLLGLPLVSLELTLTVYLQAPRFAVNNS